MPRVGSQLDTNGSWSAVGTTREKDSGERLILRNVNEPRGNTAAKYTVAHGNAANTDEYLHNARGRGAVIMGSRRKVFACDPPEGYENA
jgi:hypothetical protein